MSKSKKAKKAADHESPAQVEAEQVQEQVESQEGDNSEGVEPTIVESSEEQLFAGQEQPQEPATEQPEEKPAPKAKVSKRPYIADVEGMLNAGSHTKPDMLAFIMDKYPTVSKGGASTFLTDLLNEKYRHWKERAVVKRADGKLQFADRVGTVPEAPAVEPAPVEVETEATTQDEQPEQPGD